MEDLTQIDKARAKSLLKELDEIKGPDGLLDWNIKAQTFLVFTAAKLYCSKGKEQNNVEEENGRGSGQK